MATQTESGYHDSTMTPALPRVLPILTLLALLAGTLPSAVAAQSPSRLIKGSSSTVYFFAQDGKRYVFPNASTYHSWYDDNTHIDTLTAEQLAAIPLGGNVTYRPGTTLVKITTDPKVYAVSRHGVLHWVASEALATSLFGADWNQKIVDVPDAFFVNYSVGAAILKTSDYDPATELTVTPTPDDNMKSAEDAHATAASQSTVTDASTLTLPVVSSPIHPNLALSVTPRTLSVGSRASFTSDASYLNGITSHKILALIAGNDKPVIWKDCGALPLCAASTPFYRTTTLLSQIIVDDTTYVSAPAIVTVQGGTAPHPVLSIAGYPTPDTVEIHATVPTGEMINTTSIMNGTSLDGAPLALCDQDCSVTLKVNVAGSITAFTYVGGRYEQSNTINVKPQ